MHDDLSFLSEKQRTAYQLRQAGMYYKKIGETMGISINGARGLVLLAQRKIREHERLQQVMAENSRPVDFALTRGELKILKCGLLVAQRRKACRNTMWDEEVPLEEDQIQALLDRINTTLNTDTRGENS